MIGQQLKDAVTKVLNGCRWRITNKDTSTDDYRQLDKPVVDELDELLTQLVAQHDPAVVIADFEDVLTESLAQLEHEKDIRGDRKYPTRWIPTMERMKQVLAWRDRGLGSCSRTYAHLDVQLFKACKLAITRKINVTTNNPDVENDRELLKRLNLWLATADGVKPEEWCDTMERPKLKCGCPDCGSCIVQYQE